MERLVDAWRSHRQDLFVADWLPRTHLRLGDHRRNPDDVVLLCKRMYEDRNGEGTSKQSNYEGDAARDSGILACRASFGSRNGGWAKSFSLDGTLWDVRDVYVRCSRVSQRISYSEQMGMNQQFLISL